MQTFRDYLDTLIRARRMQYAEVARAVGVTKSYIGQLVHGHSKPPPRKRCEQIAEVLDLPPDERQRLVDLSVRERARVDSRRKIEELEGGTRALRSAAGELISALCDAGVTLPGHLAELADKSAERLAEQVEALAASLRASSQDMPAIDGSETAAMPSRPPIPIIGYIAAFAISLGDSTRRPTLSCGRYSSRPFHGNGNRPA